MAHDKHHMTKIIFLPSPILFSFALSLSLSLSLSLAIFSFSHSKNSSKSSSFTSSLHPNKQKHNNKEENVQKFKHPKFTPKRNCKKYSKNVCLQRRKNTLKWVKRNKSSKKTKRKQETKKGLENRKKNGTKKSWQFWALFENRKLDDLTENQEKSEKNTLTQN